MNNKVEILMHPVRMKICQVLMRNKEDGLTPLEMVKSLKMYHKPHYIDSYKLWLILVSSM